MAKNDFEFNVLFHDARIALGLSRPAVADAANQQAVMRTCGHVPLDENYIGRVEQGRIGGGMCAERRDALCLTLQVDDPTDIGLVAERRRPTRRRPPALRRTNPAPANIEQSGDERPDVPARVAETADELAVILDHLTEMAHQLGWTAIQPLIRRNLNGFDYLRSIGRPADNHTAFLEARWAEFMSWACDNGGHGESEDWLNRAHARAIDADDRTFIGYTLMRRSQRALDSGDAHRAVTLSRTALGENDLPPRVKALCLTRLAEGLALAGHDDSLDLLATATRYTSDTDQRPQDRIARHCDHRYLLAAQARCHYLLGRPDEAIAIIDDVLTDTPPTASVDHSMWMIYRADALGHTSPEEAATVGHAVLSSANAGSSARVIRALLPLAVTLRPHAHRDHVTAFLTAHRTALADLLPQ